MSIGEVGRFVEQLLQWTDLYLLLYTLESEQEPRLLNRQLCPLNICCLTCGLTIVPFHSYLSSPSVYTLSFWAAFSPKYTRNPTSTVPTSV